MGKSRTSYFINQNCRPTYAWNTSLSSSNVVVDDFLVFNAGEALSSQNALFIGSDGSVFKATASASSVSITGSIVVGFSISASLLNQDVPVGVRLGKVIDGFSGLNTGSRYYLSEVPGAISSNTPQSSGTVVYQVGLAKSSTELIFRPELIVRKFDI